jgi:hypothetical protein
VLGLSTFIHRSFHTCGQRGVQSRGVVVHGVPHRARQKRTGLAGKYPSEKDGTVNVTPRGRALKRLAGSEAPGFFPLPWAPARLRRAGTPGPRPLGDGRPRALVEEIMGEANLPAQKAKAHADPRVSGADVDPGGPGGCQVPPPEGPAQAHRLTWRVRDRSTFSALASAPGAGGACFRWPGSRARMTSRPGWPTPSAGRSEEL